MNYKLKTAAIALLVTVATAISVSAQKPTRIAFKKGATSAVVTGKLSGYGSKRVFVIRVKAGQRMVVEGIGSRPVTIWIEGPPGYEQDLAADCHGRTLIDPTLAGDFTLTVAECQKADPWRGTFRVRVSVR